MWLLFIVIAVLSVAVLTLGVALFYKSLPETTHVTFKEEEPTFDILKHIDTMRYESRPEKPTPPPMRKIDSW